jgi:catechol 2,3-dioxygenase-like lactoylglutathione lyase family enzyme
VDVRGLTDFLIGWSALHGGVVPAGPVRWWLRAVYPVARVLRAVPPLALTVAGLVAGWLAVWPAVSGWPLVAAACVALAVACDALDGAVAVLAGAASPFGAVADAVADRLTEAAFGVALWQAGAPGWLCGTAVGVGWLHEYLRGRAGRGVSAITVSERPTRVLFGFFGLVAAAVWPALLGGVAGAWVAVAVAGLAQLGLSYRAPRVAGMTVANRISIVTLGVRDLAASIAFYQALGWSLSSASNDDIAWFRTADSVLGLFGHDALAEDAGVPAEATTGFRGITLAINLDSPAEVDAAMEVAAAAGARVVTPSEKVFWGGYRGYFADPDGHLWELAHNPMFGFTPGGQLDLP